MNNFEYSNPTRLVFGKGEESRIGELMRARVPAMSPVLVVYGGPFPSVCWAAPAAGRRARAMRPGRRPSSPACASACRTAPRWQTRSTDF